MRKPSAPSSHVSPSYFALKCSVVYALSYSIMISRSIRKNIASVYDNRVFDYSHTAFEHFLVAESSRHGILDAPHHARSALEESS